MRVETVSTPQHMTRASLEPLAPAFKFDVILPTVVLRIILKCWNSVRKCTT